MKRQQLFVFTVLILLLPDVNLAQAPPLGSAAEFVLFSTAGSVGNTGTTILTGNVGTNSGAITGFGNVNGVMHNNDVATAQCAADLLIAYNLLNNIVPTFLHSVLLGNGETLVPGIYALAGISALNLELTLDAQGDANAVFIFQIQAAFSTNINSRVTLINGALACNVFWKVEGLVEMATGTFMRGTIIANNAGISMSTGDTLEGRALSTTGIVNVSGIVACTPLGCGGLILTGPVAPVLGSTACYALFTSSGDVINIGTSHVTGDIGSNVGITTGFDALLVNGMIHANPDISTEICKDDLLGVFNYLNVLPADIELLFPPQFGNGLVLTPHTYILNAATVLTGKVYFNAQGNTHAIFVIRTSGALSTIANAQVILTDGAQAKNVFWQINGAVSINDNSEFRGTIICNGGAIELGTGVTLDGRALTGLGAFATHAINVVMPPGCNGTASPEITAQPGTQTVCAGSPASFSVIATGTGLTYQWRKGTVNITNGGSFYGANTATLTISPVNFADASSVYNVVVGGTYAPEDTSIEVSLDVKPVPFTSGIFHQ